MTWAYFRFRRLADGLGLYAEEVRLAVPQVKSDGSPYPADDLARFIVENARTVLGARSIRFMGVRFQQVR